jgi:hypothetical protein
LNAATYLVKHKSLERCFEEREKYYIVKYYSIMMENKSNSSFSNHINIDYEGTTLTIRVNGKLRVKFNKSDLGSDEFIHEYLKQLFEGLERIITYGENTWIETFQLMAAAPSLGDCNVCGKYAQLFGGLCPIGVRKI